MNTSEEPYVPKTRWLNNHPPVIKPSTFGRVEFETTRAKLVQRQRELDTQLECTQSDLKHVFKDSVTWSMASKTMGRLVARQKVLDASIERYMKKYQLTMHPITGLSIISH